MTAGGPRKGSGRKTVEDKKVPITIYMPKSRIDALGKKTIVEITVQTIENEYQKTKPK